MTPRERGRLGGKATLARHGQDHMSKIGAVGFAHAMENGWGAYLLDKLAPGYRAKFGREPVLGRNTAGDRARAQARKDKPALGLCAWPGCTRPATDRHHVDRWTRSGDTCGLCAPHLVEFERTYRAERKRWRGRNVEPISPRALAISIGLGLDGAVPF